MLNKYSGASELLCSEPVLDDDHHRGSIKAENLIGCSLKGTSKAGIRFFALVVAFAGACSAQRTFFSCANLTGPDRSSCWAAAREANAQSLWPATRNASWLILANYRGFFAGTTLWQAYQIKLGECVGTCKEPAEFQRICPLIESAEIRDQCEARSRGEVDQSTATADNESPTESQTAEPESQKPNESTESQTDNSPGVGSADPTPPVQQQPVPRAPTPHPKASLPDSLNGAPLFSVKVCKASVDASAKFLIIFVPTLPARAVATLAYAFFNDLGGVDFLCKVIAGDE